MLRHLPYHLMNTESPPGKTQGFSCSPFLVDRFPQGGYDFLFLIVHEPIYSRQPLTLLFLATNTKSTFSSQLLEPDLEAFLCFAQALHWCHRLDRSLSLPNGVLVVIHIHLLWRLLSTAIQCFICKQRPDIFLDGCCSLLRSIKDVSMCLVLMLVNKVMSYLSCLIVLFDFHTKFCPWSPEETYFPTPPCIKDKFFKNVLNINK